MMRVAHPHREVVIVKTGVANLASVIAAFERLGAATVVTTDPDLVREARAVMLPGVGAFGAGMAALRAGDGALAEALRGRFAADRPTMAICLGLQLLCHSSEETPGVEGLGLLAGHVTRFADAASLKVPQLGWNRVEIESDSHIATSESNSHIATNESDSHLFLEPGFAYFANSYKLDVAPPGWRAARANHGGPFIAALERGHLLACQFHPELSGPWGMALMGRWLDAAYAPAASTSTTAVA